jgi:hypothetical protein
MVLIVKGQRYDLDIICSQLLSKLVNDSVCIIVNLSCHIRLGPRHAIRGILTRAEPAATHFLALRVHQPACAVVTTPHTFAWFPLVTLPIRAFISASTISCANIVASLTHAANFAPFLALA